MLMISKKNNTTTQEDKPSMKQIKLLTKTKYALLALALVASNFYFLAGSASAATLTNTYVQLNRLSAGQTTSFRLVFKTVGAGATSVSVNFNGADSPSWSTNSGVVNATQTVTSGLCAATTGATALPGTITAAGASNTVTISSVTALSATTLYCVDLTSTTAVTNATAAEYHPVVTAGADSTTVAIRTITNDSIVVSATVPPTFNLALSSNVDSFSTALSSGSVKVSTGNTVTVSTNAKNGWFVWAFSVSSSGLTSVVGASNIPATTPGTTATVVAGTPGYVFGVTGNSAGTGSGAITVATAYSSNGTTTGSGLDTTIRQIASSSGTNAGATLTIKELAAISATTPAANDYTDTITIIGAGYF